MPDDPRAADAEPTIDPLEERLRSFEAFDRLIAENISRSGAMVREAIELRERARREIAAERAALADVIAAERDRVRADALARQADMQATISAALADIDTLRAEMDVLASRLRTVVTPASEPAPEPAAATAPVTSAPAAPAEVEIAPSPVEADAETGPSPDAACVDSAAASDQPQPMRDTGDSLVPPASEGVDHEQPVEPEAATDAIPGEPTAPSAAGDSEPEPSPAPEEHTDAPDAGEPALEITPDADIYRGETLTLVVQNIRRATVASVLQRHLAAQDGVAAVEPREFAEGIFRLHLVLDGPFDLAVLREWAADADATFERPAPAFVTMAISA